MTYMVLQASTLSLSVVLNSTLVVAICVNARLRTTPRAFIASLALSDVAFSFYGIVHIAVLIYENQVCRLDDTDDILDRSVSFATYFSIMSNYTNILLVSMERWAHIARPFWHQRHVSVHVTAVGITITWFCAVLVNVDAFLLPGYLYLKVADMKHSTVYPSIHFLSSFTLCGIYIHLSIITRRQICAITRTHTAGVIGQCERADNLSSFHQKLGSLKGNLKSVRLLLLIFGTFFLLLTPDMCFHIYMTYGARGVYERSIHEFLKELTYIHCCVNFFVFAAKDGDFRCVLAGYFRKAKECQHGLSRRQGGIFQRKNRVTPLSSSTSETVLSLYS